MDKEAERDKLIELGFQWEDFFVSIPGKFFIERLQQKIGLTANSMMFDRIKTGPKTYDFSCLEISHFERHRGFALGVQWVLDEISSAIKFAKREEEERKKRAEEEKST